MLYMVKLKYTRDEILFAWWATIVVLTHRPAVTAPHRSLAAVVPGFWNSELGCCRPAGRIVCSYTMSMRIRGNRSSPRRRPRNISGQIQHIAR
jgi:hypothetical protein